MVIRGRSINRLGSEGRLSGGGARAEARPCFKIRAIEQRGAYWHLTLLPGYLEPRREPRLPS